MDEFNFTTKQVNSLSDIASFYDDYASDWSNRFGTSISAEHVLRRRLDISVKAGQLNTDKDMIELGCGNGDDLSLLAKCVRSALGIDVSERMLEEAQRKLSNAKNVSFQHSPDGLLGGVASDSVDIVLCHGVVEHFLEPVKTLSDCHGAIREGGRIVIASPNGQCPWYSVKSAFRGGRSHFSTDVLYRPEEYVSLLTKAGFKDIQYEIWGVVPPGSPNFTYRFLAVMETIIEKSFLRKFAGSISLVGVKK